MITNQELLSINPKDYQTTVLTSEQILQWFDSCDAGWTHDGNPKKPHAKLHSGQCSNGYYNCSEVLCYPNLCEILASQLAKKFNLKVDWVVSAAYAGITFGHDVAKALGAKFGYTEKDPENPKGQIWKRFTIPKGSIVLQVEELITTSGTFKEVNRTIREADHQKEVEFLPLIGTLIHRPLKLPIEYDGRKVIPLVEKEIWAVEPEDCPLCAKGSKPLRPKDNWAELTG